MHPGQDGTQKKNSGERIRDCLHYFVFEFARPEKKQKCYKSEKVQAFTRWEGDKNTGKISNIY